MSRRQSKSASSTVKEENASAEVSIENSIEQAKRAYALNNYEQAVEHYATALELMTDKYGDASPECVDLYFAYGKALLENAIAQSSVLGKEETSATLDADDEADHKAAGSSRTGPGGRIHFGEDSAIDEERDQDEGERTVDLFAEAIKEGLEEQRAHEHEADEEDEGEPEDDFNAAWEVLEVARSLYLTQKDSSDEVKLKLADTYIALGDVSLETEKLDQAISDYTAAAALKAELLPLSSRQIAEVHYKLCIVYDMTSGRLAQAIEHARKAEASVQTRLNELETRLNGLSAKDNAGKASSEEKKPNAKGKGKAISTILTGEHALTDMTKEQLEVEIKELRGLLEDVSLKIEELKTSPETIEGSAPDLVAQELDRDLNNAVATAVPKQINDLTSVVKKKRRAPETSEDTGDKQKGAVSTPPEKKTKLGDTA
ncbi:hypothetical protein BU17DRAFT_48239 [Hysterangium stoloniferum]|nr:hypothetical protein BU17DRAFT_48239 [Hysterangium stoloniferum]